MTSDERLPLMLMRLGIRAAKRSAQDLDDGDKDHAKRVADGVRRMRLIFPLLGEAYDRTLTNITKRKFGRGPR